MPSAVIQVPLSTSLFAPFYQVPNAANERLANIAWAKCYTENGSGT